MTIEAVIFEAENVLYDGTAWWRWLVGVLRHLGHSVQYQAFCRSWYDQHWTDVCLGRRSHRQAFRTFLAEDGLSASQIDEVDTAAQSQKHRLASPLRAFQGVHSTLSHLREQSVRLGVLANSDLTSEQLGAALARMGLRHFFQSVLSSRDLGACTPSAEAYSASLSELHCSAEDAAFVAFDQDALDGAARLGLVPIAFNYSADTQANLHACRFCEIAALVANVGGGVAVAG